MNLWVTKRKLVLKAMWTIRYKSLFWRDHVYIANLWFTVWSLYNLIHNQYKIIPKAVSQATKAHKAASLKMISSPFSPPHTPHPIPPPPPPIFHPHGQKPHQSLSIHHLVELAPALLSHCRPATMERTICHTFLWKAQHFSYFAFVLPLTKHSIFEGLRPDLGSKDWK